MGLGEQATVCKIECVGVPKRSSPSLLTHGVCDSERRMTVSGTVAHASHYTCRMLVGATAGPPSGEEKR